MSGVVNEPGGEPPGVNVYSYLPWSDNLYSQPSVCVWPPVKLDTALFG